MTSEDIKLEGGEKVEAGGMFTWKDKEVGTRFLGIYKGCDMQKTQQGEGLRCDFQTKDGDSFFFAGTILEQRLKTIPVGSIVDIKYTGDKTTSSGRKMKEFEVFQYPATAKNLKAVGLAEEPKKVEPEESDEIKEEDLPDLD